MREREVVDEVFVLPMSPTKNVVVLVQNTIFKSQYVGYDTDIYNVYNANILD